MTDAGYNLSNRIPIDGTLISLLLPSFLVCLVAIPGGFYTFTLYRPPDGEPVLVNSGMTANYYWLLLQYVPVIVTLTFATSMVYSGRVVATVWAEGTSDEAAMLLEHSGEQTEEAAKLSSMAAIAGAGKFGKKLKDKADDKLDARSKEALKEVRRMSKFERVQWLLLFVLIAEIIAVGNIADPDTPLWNEEMRIFLVGFCVLGLLLALFASFTLKNLRTTMVKREGKKTVEYVAQFLSRITIVLIVQHLCFFFVGVVGINLSASFQPVAFSSISTREDTEPCSLVTPTCEHCQALD